MKRENEKSHITLHTSQNSGITLVALIITIIVLLILAVVAIRAVQGDGIIQHAKEAKSKTEQAQANELGILSGYEMELEKNSPTTLSDEIIGTKFEKTTFVKDGKGKIFVVPAGYIIVKDDTTSNTVEVDKGVVITDGTSEFVWVPTTADIVAYGLNSLRYREPDVVTGADPSSVDSASGTSDDAESGNLSKVLEGEYANTKTASSFKNQLTSEFNKMVASVNKYHGFYVGRYETSLNGATAQSKAGKIPMNNINWYAMYTNSKTYAPENSSKSVVSQMIWGSQWDAMIDYIKTTDDKDHVTATTNVGHTSSDFKIKPYKTGGTNYYTEAYKGTTDYNDKAANIYDLEGNVSEWTQEAYRAGVRVTRGGIYNDAYSPSSRYNYNVPTFCDSNRGSRLALYIK